MSWLAPHSHMPPNFSKWSPPMLPTSLTKSKCVKAQCIALLIIKDGGCTLIFEKVTNYD